MMRKFQGTPAFSPPETIGDDPFMPWPLDIWAVGITLYMFGHGRPPFHQENIPITDLYERITKDEPNYNRELDLGYLSCVERCLVKDPKKRVTLWGLKTHYWVTKSGQDPLCEQEFSKLRKSSERKNLITKRERYNF